MSILDQLQVTDPDEPVAAAPAGGAKKKSILQFELTKKKVPRKELMHFSRQLAVFIRAGIPILDALEAILEEMSNKVFRAVVEDILARLQAGATLAHAANQHPDVFPPYYLGILHSAELTGRLDTVLVQLSDDIERDVEARQKIKSALTYPAVIAAMSVVVVIILVGFVLPKFEAFFANLNAKLPLPTRILLSGGHLLTTNWYYFVGGFLGICLILAAFLRRERGRRLRDQLLLKLPVIGDLAQHVLLERFCRILSSLMQAGVALPEAMRVTAGATTNIVYQDGLSIVRDAMLRGEGLATPLIESGLFPPSARQMFRVGEATGTLDDQLETAAGYFKRELDYKITRFTNLFEPAVILAMGLVVGFVAVALVSAMYGIFRAQHV